MKIYLFAYLGSVLLALASTPVAIWFARRLSIVDVPGIRRIHSSPTPRIGGTAIFFSMMCVSLGVLFFPQIGGERRDILSGAAVLLCGATFVFIVGLIDDVKTDGLAACIKLLSQTAAAMAVCTAGIRIRFIAVADWFTLDFGWFSWIMTVLWIVGITNAVNLSDGLDGLAAGVSAVACAVIAVFAIYSGQALMAALVLALLGSLSGFLLFNFNPARVFMGDCGSMFLGFTLASTSVMCSTKSAALVGLALPFLALGIPIFDTLFSMLRRIIERRSIFAPDRRHFHHRLIDLGLQQRHAVIAIYAATVLFAGMGMFMMVARDIGSLAIFFCVLLLLLLAFHVVSSVRLKDAITGLQRKYAIERQAHRETKSFEQAQLHFCNARTFDQWWSAICNAAGRMDFAWVSLRTQNTDGTDRTEMWRPSDNQPDAFDLVVMTVPIRNPEMSEATKFEIAIKVNGTIESAGHRATLFSRLIDEHKLVELQR